MLHSKESPSLTATRESPRAATKTHHRQKYIFFFKKGRVLVKVCTRNTIAEMHKKRENQRISSGGGGVPSGFFFFLIIQECKERTFQKSCVPRHLLPAYLLGSHPVLHVHLTALTSHDLTSTPSSSLSPLLRCPMLILSADL